MTTEDTRLNAAVAVLHNRLSSSPSLADAVHAQDMTINKSHEIQEQQAVLADNAGPFVPAPSALATAESALRFILAGNAYFTIRSEKTGVRYTYRVSLPKDEKPENVKRYGRSWFVALLIGSDNTSDYSYLGVLQNNKFKLTRASRMTLESIPVKAFRWVIENLAAGKIPSQTEIWHNGKCGRCGRMLTVPESVAAGIGPECAGRMGL